MDQLHSIRVFIAVAECQGFAAGARKLQLSPPAVTRAVAQLEQHLGVQLLKRSTRHVRLTQAGERYLEDSHRLIAALQLADEAAAGIHAAPSGPLVVTAPVLFGQQQVMPVVLAYLNRFSATQIEALFVDRLVNLLEEGVDVAVRIGPLADSNLRAIPVGQVNMWLFASPEYLDKQGRPETLEQLAQHTTIASRAGGQSSRWVFAGNQVLKLSPRLEVSSNAAVIDAAAAGFGIARLMSYQVADKVASGEFERLLPHLEPAPLPVHVVHREGRLASTKVRSFIDQLVLALRNSPALNG